METGFSFEAVVVVVVVIVVASVVSSGISIRESQSSSEAHKSDASISSSDAWEPVTERRVS